MPTPWFVLKFGGTSVASADRWETIERIVRERQDEGRVWLTLSALGGVTDRLQRAAEMAVSGDVPDIEGLLEVHVRLARSLGLDELPRPAAGTLDRVAGWLQGVRLLGEASPRMRARLLAAGELASSHLAAAYLSKRGLDVRWVDARDLLASEDRPGEPEERHFLEARVPVRADPEAVERAAAGASIVVTQGFLARDARGETCLLGRGGSDTSAALFARLAEARRLEIWTDVPGLFTADPGDLPQARLILRIGYREAQELAATGARVLHPRCLVPMLDSGIPIEVRSTLEPDLNGTRIEAVGEEYPTVNAVTCRQGSTLLTVSTLRMWGRPGFLSDVFRPFADLDISVDLVGTSQSAVSVTLDDVPGGVRGPRFAELLRRLEALGDVRVIHPCSVVSIVGRDIRAVLHELGPALEAFQERPVHLVSDSSEDLNLSFVVEEEDGPALVRRLHQRLFPAQGGDSRLGPTWEMLAHARNAAAPGVDTDDRWWHTRGDQLAELVADGAARFVYDLTTVRARARDLRRQLRSVDRVYYAMKANAHPRVLETIAGEGLGIECVSLAELIAARDLLGDGVPYLFTPNFCPVEEYSAAFDLGAEVVIDNANVLRDEPERFRGRRLGLRCDPGRGRGHHRKVRTGGAHAKFGVPLGEVDEVVELARGLDVQLVGLHAHVGSGILDADAWADTWRALAGLAERFPALEWIDPGGGLGVVERPGQRPLELARVDAALEELKSSIPGVGLRLEPGRYLVSEGGVLVAPVTQVRRRAGVNFAGLPTGMNSLLRPALYGAWHGIHNLTRRDDPRRDYWHVVGPICESADVFGRDRWMPPTEPGDVLLIENAGAYGAAMASRYNLREPAAEVVLEPVD